MKIEKGDLLEWHIITHGNLLEWPELELDPYARKLNI